MIMALPKEVLEMEVCQFMARVEEGDPGCVECADREFVMVDRYNLAGVVGLGVE